MTWLVMSGLYWVRRDMVRLSRFALRPKPIGNFAVGNHWWRLV